jgi:Kef-type K+ transport system membrane component KefB
VLLLLLLGLEYSAAELVTGLRRSWTAGLLDIVLNAAPGVAVALLLGWGSVGAIVIAGLAVSYTAVSAELAALATAYVLLMAVLGPIAARVVEPAARCVRSRIPARSAAPTTSGQPPRS